MGVPCTATTLALFDPLEREGQSGAPPLVRGGYGGRIQRCMDVSVGDYIFSDHLRVMLGAPDEAPEYTQGELFSDKAKGEFLFRIFSHLAIGGPATQYEDEALPYLDSAKAVYKSLVVPRRGPKGGAEVVSSVYALTGLELDAAGGDSDATLFPAKSALCGQAWCYASVDHSKRKVTMW